jgi:hypothetical protein
MESLAVSYWPSKEDFFSGIYLPGKEDSHVPGKEESLAGSHLRSSCPGGQPMGASQWEIVYLRHRATMPNNGGFYFTSLHGPGNQVVFLNTATLNLVVIVLQKSYFLHQRRFHGQGNPNHPLHAILCVKWKILGDNFHWPL